MHDECHVEAPVTGDDLSLTAEPNLMILLRNTTDEASRAGDSPLGGASDHDGPGDSVTRALILILITVSANPKPEGHRAYTQSVCSHICGA